MPRKGTPRKPGPLKEKEKVAIGLILDINPDVSYANIARLLNRRQEPIIKYIEATRDCFRFAAPHYLELHMRAASIAASNGNAAPAQWALERMETTDETGASVRVVEAPAQRYDTGRIGEGGLVVNVGLVVSQVAPTASAKPALTLPSLPIERTDNGVSLLDSIG